jgi:hypothetical protein
MEFRQPLFNIISLIFTGRGAFWELNHPFL